jgi:hypothetical protein
MSAVILHTLPIFHSACVGPSFVKPINILVHNQMSKFFTPADCKIRRGRKRQTTKTDRG